MEKCWLTPRGHEATSRDKSIDWGEDCVAVHLSDRSRDGLHGHIGSNGGISTNDVIALK